MKKFKIFNYTLIILFLLLLSSCFNTNTETSYTVYFMMNDLTLESMTVQENDTVERFEPDYIEGEIFDNWYLDDTYTSLYDFDTPITQDTYIYAHYITGYYKVSFVTNSDTVIEDEYVVRRNTVTKPDDPVKEYYKFIGWYSDETLLTPFNFETKINKNYTLYAKYEVDLTKASTVKYVLPEDMFFNKEDLFESFIGDFYYFLKDHTDCNLDDIPTVDDFYTLFKTWELNGRSDLYHIGDRFQAYYITFDEDGKVEDQPTDTFIGYLWQEGRYHDFINHLITFFAYWRTDEGYTSQDVHGNDFFYSSWASLVDSAKFFYFTSSTLNTKYAWFKSKRVKDALDNIPGVLKVNSPETLVADTYTLPTYNIEGYTFNGYYSDDTYETLITEISREMIARIENITIYVDIQYID